MTIAQIYYNQIQKDTCIIQCILVWTYIVCYKLVLYPRVGHPIFDPNRFVSIQEDRLDDYRILHRLCTQTSYFCTLV